MLALVALGSNLGNRDEILRAALAGLARLPQTRLIRASSFHETAPEAPGDGPPFLNGAALLHTSLAPTDLLRHLGVLERRAGRVRIPGAPRGPRTLDLDLILHGRHTVQRPDLVVPHPRFRDRLFVLAPAAEIAPSLVDPQTGRRLHELAAGQGLTEPEVITAMSLRSKRRE